MNDESKVILEAIERWASDDLIDRETADRLRAAATEEAGAGTRRLSQYILAATGAVALLIAGGVFLDWAWPLLDRAARSVALAAVGLLVVALGVRVELGRRWQPASYLMQTGGLGLLLAAFAYSEEVWRDQTPAGITVGVLALAVPIVLAPRAMRRNVVMPAVHLAFGLAFLAVFLDRATPLSDDAVVWVLDGVLLLAGLTLMRMIAADPDGERHPWALNAFVMAMIAGFQMILVTGLGPLGLSGDVVWPLDVWLFLCAALTVIGVRRTPYGARRDWLGRALAVLLCVWIGFGFYTALEALDGPPELAVALVGGAGVAGFLYANASGFRHLMGAAALAFIAPLWYWGVERGGAIGAALALAATAGILFWLSGRVGSGPRAHDDAG